MKISDKTVGYISFAALLLIIAVIAFGMWKAHQESSTTATIDFNELGSLQPEDPVTENGYDIGHVKSVQWLGNLSRVVIVFDNPITLRESSSFKNVGFALMGQRRIEVTRPKEGNRVPKDYVFQGEFVPGITETLRFMKDIQIQVLQIRDVVLLIANGNDTTPSFTKVFNTTLHSVDSLLNSLDKTTRAAGPQINNLLHKANTASRTVEQTANTADSLMSSITIKADSAVKDAKLAMLSISNGISKIDEITLSVQNDTLAQNLLKTREKIDRIDSLITKVNELIKAVNTKGAAIYDDHGNKVDLIKWKNLNIIGKTAREKAKERQEKH
ncbi:MAG: MlaD family protein [Fibrobacteraceae bacterium]